MRRLREAEWTGAEVEGGSRGGGQGLWLHFPQARVLKEIKGETRDFCHDPRNFCNFPSKPLHLFVS